MTILRKQMINEGEVRLVKYFFKEMLNDIHPRGDFK